MIKQSFLFYWAKQCTSERKKLNQGFIDFRIHALE